MGILKSKVIMVKVPEWVGGVNEEATVARYGKVATFTYPDSKTGSDVQRKVLCQGIVWAKDNEYLLGVQEGRDWQQAFKRGTIKGEIAWSK